MNIFFGQFDTTRELCNWLRANRPELWARLSDLPIVDGLPLLNEATGLNVQVDDPIADGSARFLEAFRAQDREPKE